MLTYRYDHLHFVSLDPVKTALFYETMFGAERIAVRELGSGRISAEVDLNGLRLKISSPSARPESVPSVSAGDTPDRLGIRTNHFGIRTNNIEAAVAELKAKGAQFTSEIRQQATGEKVALLLAPENVLVELVERSD